MNTFLNLHQVSVNQTLWPFSSYIIFHLPGKVTQCWKHWKPSVTESWNSNVIIRQNHVTIISTLTSVSVLTLLWAIDTQKLISRVLTRDTQQWVDSNILQMFTCKTVVCYWNPLSWIMQSKALCRKIIAIVPGLQELCKENYVKYLSHPPGKVT